MGTKDDSLSELLQRLERELRGYIRYKLSSIDVDWWKSRIPQQIRETCEERKRSLDKQWPQQNTMHSHAIDFANFNDYIRIITQRTNWKEIFGASLGDQIVLEGKFRELETARNVIAHNREFPQDAQEQFRLNADYVLKRIQSDESFLSFRTARGTDWQLFVERCHEDDIIWIVAGNPWLFGTQTYFKGKNVSIGMRKIDLLFEDIKGFQTYVEVKFSSIDIDQIRDYASGLGKKLEEQQCRLIWFVPQSFSSQIENGLKNELQKMHIESFYYDVDFFTDWAYLRRHARTLLDELNTYIAAPFRYTIGRKEHSTFDYDFKNLPDALYFYGYAEEDGKKKKVGFHLATLGWYFDLLRNLSDSNFQFAHTNPELILKLIVESLEYPYLYRDTKATPKQTYRPLGVVDMEGFIHHLIGYKKKGRIEDIKEEMKKQHESLRRFYSQSLGPFMGKLRRLYPLKDPVLSLMREDILEGVAARVAHIKTQMNTLPAGSFRDGIVDRLNLIETEFTELIKMPDLLATNAKADDKGTYRANMAKRIVEIMSLKRIIDVHTYIVPTYEILILVRDTPMIQGVQTFRLNEDGRIRRQLLR